METSNIFVTLITAIQLCFIQGEARGNKIKISLPLSFCSSFFALQGVATFRLSVCTQAPRA